MKALSYRKERENCKASLRFSQGFLCDFFALFTAFAVEIAFRNKTI
jgi:hypothetical protein